MIILALCSGLGAAQAAAGVGAALIDHVMMLLRIDVLDPAFNPPDSADDSDDAAAASD